MTGNEAALCACHVYFPVANEVFLAVGTAVGLTFAPRDCDGGFVHLYRYLEDGTVTLVHKTPLDGVPGAMCGFKGRLLLGCGNALRLYDFGKKKLLRKVENRLLQPVRDRRGAAQRDGVPVVPLQESLRLGGLGLLVDERRESLRPRLGGLGLRVDHREEWDARGAVVAFTPVSCVAPG